VGFQSPSLRVGSPSCFEAPAISPGRVTRKGYAAFRVSHAAKTPFVTICLPRNIGHGPERMLDRGKVRLPAHPLPQGWPLTGNIERLALGLPHCQALKNTPPVQRQAAFTA
jgi:hypothetical protein